MDKAPLWRVAREFSVCGRELRSALLRHVLTRLSRERTGALLFAATFAQNSRAVQVKGKSRIWSKQQECHCVCIYGYFMSPLCQPVYITYHQAARQGARSRLKQSALFIRLSARPHLLTPMTSFSRCIQQHFMCCWPFLDLYIEDPPPPPRKSKSRRRHQHRSPHLIREVKVRLYLVSLPHFQFVTTNNFTCVEDNHMLARHFALKRKATP
jgi:hypothetical protein